MFKFIKKYFGNICTSLSIILLLVSLTQKCYCTTDVSPIDDGCGDSIAVYLSGWAVVYYSWANMTWLVNPVLLLSWIFVKKNPKFSLITSLIAFLLTISFLFCSKVMDNQNGDLSRITGYKLGYWLWMISSLIMFIGNGISYFVFGVKKITTSSTATSKNSL